MKKKNLYPDLTPDIKRTNLVGDYRTRFNEGIYKRVGRE